MLTLSYAASAARSSQCETMPARGATNDVGPGGRLSRSGQVARPMCRSVAHAMMADVDCRCEIADQGARRDGFCPVRRSYLLKANSTRVLAVMEHLHQNRQALLPLYDQCHTRWVSGVTSSTQVRS